MSWVWRELAYNRALAKHPSSPPPALDSLLDNSLLSNGSLLNTCLFQRKWNPIFFSVSTCTVPWDLRQAASQISKKRGEARPPEVLFKLKDPRVYWVLLSEAQGYCHLRKPPEPQIAAPEPWVASMKPQRAKRQGPRVKARVIYTLDHLPLP